MESKRAQLAKENAAVQQKEQAHKALSDRVGRFLQGDLHHPSTYNNNNDSNNNNYYYSNNNNNNNNNNNGKYHDNNNKNGKNNIVSKHMHT